MSEKQKKSEQIRWHREGHREKISAKIARKVGIPTCIIFLLVAVILGVLVKLQLDAANGTELTLESESTANELNTFFQHHLKTVKNLAVNPQAINAVSDADAAHKITETKDFPTVYEYMVNMQQEDSENVLAVWVSSVAGNVLTQSDGFTSGSDFEVTGREWYQTTQTKKAMLTKPYIDASTGQMIVSAAAPILDASGKAVGVAGLDLALTHVSDVLEKCKIGETGYMVMMADDGTIIYHPDSSLIDSFLMETVHSANLEKLIQTGSEGFTEYKYNGDKRYGYLTGIGDTGYMVLSSLSVKEFSESVVRMIVLMVVIFALGTIVIFLAIRQSASAITKPIEELDAAAKELADGNLDVHLEVTTNDEIGELGRSIQQTVARLKVYIAYIDEISAVLADMADGRLSIVLKQEYAGDFKKVKDALLNISASMMEVLTGITESSGQVSTGAEDLAKASQMLAEGASEQAASVEELVAASDRIVSQLQVSKADAQSCAQEARKTSKLADEGKMQMMDMLDAMTKISETSKQVVGIIHTIEEIAEQTNLLSLNASIEAARAGEAGRGFAVVASEIGALANQSSDAAANTRNLIGVSMSEIERGAALADQVTEALSVVVENVGQVSEMVTHTADLAVEQEENMEQMQAGINSIAQAVQDTSATAEESSATSEELAAQAIVLTELIAKFDLGER